MGEPAGNKQIWNVTDHLKQKSIPPSIDLNSDQLLWLQVMHSTHRSLHSGIQGLHACCFLVFDLRAETIPWCKLPHPPGGSSSPSKHCLPTSKELIENLSYGRGIIQDSNLHLLCFVVEKIMVNSSYATVTSAIIDHFLWVNATVLLQRLWKMRYVVFHLGMENT